MYIYVHVVTWLHLISQYINLLFNHLFVCCYQLLECAMAAMNYFNKEFKIHTLITYSAEDTITSECNTL